MPILEPISVDEYRGKNVDKIRREQNTKKESDLNQQ